MSEVSSTPPDFSGLSRWYRALEFVAFGRDLERTRFCHLDALRDCRSVLILGEGDGRFLARLLREAPGTRVDCVEGSRGMIRAAEARLSTEQRGKVHFECADLRSFTPNANYDAVVTLFVLDCFTTAEVEALVVRVAPRRREGAHWVFADFALPKRGWRRLRAQVWLEVLYAFFGWRTGLRVRALPDAETVLVHAGFTAERVREYQHGMLRAVVFRRA
jgi:SAM-dependent methyltransferase